MTQRILVYGGAGALGKSVLQKFSQQGWKTFAADIAPITSKHVTNSFQIDGSKSAKDNVNDVSQWLNTNNVTNEKFDCIVHTAGGFMMDNILSDNFFDQLDTMWKWNSLSAFATASLAARYLNNSGLLVLTGASGALNATPSILSYGTSKAIVHHLIKSMADSTEMPKDSKTIGILPYVT